MDSSKAKSTSIDQISEVYGIFRISSGHLDQRGGGRIRRRDEKDLLEGDHLEDAAGLCH